MNRSNRNKNKTEFYFKLASLNDKIKKYKVRFGEWDKDYIHKPRERTPEEEVVNIQHNRTKK